MVSILIRCTVILVALHFKVQTVSIILYYYLSLKLVHCLGTWSLCDLSPHYLHVPEWLICKLFDNTAPTKLWAILEICKIMLWHCFVERKEWRCRGQKEFIIWRYPSLNTLLIQNWMWINFYSPKESMYRYSLIFLVTPAVHALNNNKVHITEKTCGTWLTSTHKYRSKIWWLHLLPSVSSTLPSGENRRENDTEGYLIWRGY